MNIKNTSKQLFFITASIILTHIQTFGTENKSIINDKISFSIDNVYDEAVQYKNGEIDGFPKDQLNTLIKSGSLFLQCAYQGNIKAMHNFAMTKYKLKEYITAYEWFAKAKNMGFEPSVNVLRLIDKEGVIKVTESETLQNLAGYFCKISTMSPDTIIEGIEDTKLTNETRVDLVNHVLFSSVFNFSENILVKWNFDRPTIQLMINRINDSDVQNYLKFKLVSQITKNGHFNYEKAIPSIAKFTVCKDIEAEFRHHILDNIISRGFNVIYYPDIFSQIVIDKEFDLNLRRAIVKNFFNFYKLIYIQQYKSIFLLFLKENLNDLDYTLDYLQNIVLHFNFKNEYEIVDILSFLKMDNIDINKKTNLIYNLITKNNFITEIIKDQILLIIENKDTSDFDLSLLSSQLLKHPFPELKPLTPLFLKIFENTITKGNNEENNSNTQTVIPFTKPIIARGLLTNPSINLSQNYDVFENFIKDEQNDYISCAFVASFLLANTNFIVSKNNIHIFEKFICCSDKLNQLQTYIFRKLQNTPDEDIKRFLNKMAQNKKITFSELPLNIDNLLFMKEYF